MLDILTRAGCFVAIIFLGYGLKKAGLFQDKDFSVLSTIVLKITLPAAVITNFANKELEMSMLIMILIGFGCGILYMLLGFLLNLRNSRHRRAFDLLNMSGYNIGCFSMPFVQSFLGPVGVISTCLFDIGNAFVCLGGAFSVAVMVQDGGKFSVKRIVRTLSRSIPFLMYILMPTLCLLHVPIPTVVTTFSGIIADANAFLAMFMIGVGFKVSANRSQLGHIVRLVAVRFGVAAVLALCFYFLLPFSGEIRKALMLLVFSPIAAAAPAFTGEMKNDVGLASAVNSICIVISIVCIVTLLTLVP